MSIKNVFKKLFTVEEEYEYIEDNVSPMPHAHEQKDNVISFTSMSHPVSKVVLCEPRTYGEVSEIADFLSGTVYAFNGDIQKLGAHTFLCTPENVEVSGSITGKSINDHDFEKEW